MTMTPVIETIIVAAAGAAVGLFHFGGLWMTVRRLGRAGRPGLILTVSIVGRLMLVLPVFLLATGGGRWDRLLALTAGFLAIRALMIRRMGCGQALRTQRVR